MEEEKGVTMRAFRMPLKAVLYKEGDIWLAHCLEFDLIGDGSTQDKALASLNKAISTQIHACIKHKCLKNLFVSADPKFWKMFATGKNVGKGELKISPIKKQPPVTIEEIEARQYSEPEADCESELVTA